MRLLSQDTENQLISYLSLKDNDWVKWVKMQNGYQDDCNKFNGCHFVLSQMPKYPFHHNCQCQLQKIEQPIPNVTAKAKCDIRKFSEYVFSDKYDDGKKELFESWGYIIEDSEYLQQLYIKQALQKYCNGDYVYKGVNNASAKISITISLFNKEGREQNINTIWSLRQNGELVLITPYSGHKY